MVLIFFRYILLLGICLLTGVEFCSTYIVHPAFLDFDSATYIPVRQALDRTFTPVVASLVFTTGTALFINLFTVKNKKSIEFALYVLAFLFFQIGILITIKGTVPINVAIDKMDPSNPPAYLDAMRTYWNTLNTYRTWSSLAGFVSFSAAIFIKTSRT